MSRSIGSLARRRLSGVVVEGTDAGGNAWNVQWVYLWDPATIFSPGPRLPNTLNNVTGWQVEAYVGNPPADQLNSTYVASRVTIPADPATGVVIVPWDQDNGLSTAPAPYPANMGPFLIQSQTRVQFFPVAGAPTVAGSTYSTTTTTFYDRANGTTPRFYDGLLNAAQTISSNTPDSWNVSYNDNGPNRDTSVGGNYISNPDLTPPFQFSVGNIQVITVYSDPLFSDIPLIYFDGISQLRKSDTGNGKEIAVSPVAPGVTPGYGPEYSGTYGTDGLIYVGYNAHFNLPAPEGRLQWVTIGQDLQTWSAVHILRGFLDTPANYQSLNQEWVCPVGNKIVACISYTDNTFAGTAGYSPRGFQMIIGNLDGSGTYSALGPYQATYNGPNPYFDPTATNDNESYPETPFAVGTDIYFTMEGAKVYKLNTLTGDIDTSMLVGAMDFTTYNPDDDLQAAVCRANGDIFAWGAADIYPFTGSATVYKYSNGVSTALGTIDATALNFTGGGVIVEPYYYFLITYPPTGGVQPLQWARVNMDTGVFQLRGPFNVPLNFYPIVITGIPVQVPVTSGWVLGRIETH